MADLEEGCFTSYEEQCTTHDSPMVLCAKVATAQTQTITDLTEQNQALRAENERLKKFSY